MLGSSLPGFCCTPAVRIPVRQRWFASVARSAPSDGKKGSVLLEKVAKHVGIDAMQLGQLRLLGDIILKANENFNLTAVRTMDGMIARHLVDGLGLLPALDDLQPTNIIDIGSGAGLPGFVLAICRPSWSVTLLEAARKKSRFQEVAAAELGLRNIQAVWGRAEELGHDPSHRERYDCACARAVAEMRVLAELALPLVRIGGSMVAQKSLECDGPHQELRAADEAVEALGGTWATVEYAWTDKPIQELLPEATGEPTDRRRAIITIHKVRPTSPRYPRAPGTPRKNPL
jgi:16S rRNA (guanine527-N7)-methyltransferase